MLAKLVSAKAESGHRGLPWLAQGQQTPYLRHLGPAFRGGDDEEETGGISLVQIQTTTPDA